MNKGYKYDSYCRNGENAADKTTEFHDLSHSDNRLNVFILKDVNKELEEFKEDLPKFEISFIYPSNIRLKINNSYLSYTTTDGNRISTVADIEYNSSIRITVVPTSGYEYVYDVTYKEKCVDSLFNNALVLSNITDNNIIQFRPKTNISSRVHFICEDTTGIEEIVINSIPISFGGSINTYFDYPRNDFEKIDFQLIFSENYMVDECRAYIDSGLSSSAGLVSNGEKYTLSLTIQSNNQEVTEYWVRFSAKRIPSDEFVVKIGFQNPRHISFFSAYGTRIFNPEKTTYKIYVPRGTTEIQITVNSAENCTLLSKTVKGVITNLNSSTSDLFILQFNQNQYGEDNSYNIAYITHDRADDVYYKINFSGVEHASVSVNGIGELSKTALGTSQTSAFELLEGSEKVITVQADSGYRFNQFPYVYSGAGEITNISYTDVNNTSVSFKISNVSANTTIMLPVIVIPTYSVTITCPVDMSITASNGTVSSSTSGNVKTIVISNLSEKSGVDLTITYADRYNYSVNGNCFRDYENDILSLSWILSNVSVELTRKSNDTCTVMFMLSGGISALNVNSVSHNTSSDEFENLFDMFLVYAEEVTNINNSTLLRFKPVFNIGYEIDLCIASYSPDGEESIDISSDIRFDGEYYTLRFSKYYNAEDALEYLESITIMITAKQIIQGEYTVEVHLTPGHISSIRGIGTNSEDTVYNPSDNVLIYKITADGTTNQSCEIIYSVDYENCDFVNATIDGVPYVESLNDITINLDTNRIGASNPYVVYINTSSLFYSVTLKGLDNVSLIAYVNPEATDFSDIFVVCEPIVENGIKLIRYNISKAVSASFIIFQYPTEFEFKKMPELISGTADEPVITIDDELTEDDIYQAWIEIENISSDIEIEMSLSLHEEWEKADFYELGKGIFYGWSADSEGNYIYGTSVSSSVATRSMCVDYKKGADYRISFDPSCGLPAIIYYRTGSLVTNDESVTDGLFSKSNFTQIPISDCEIDSASNTVIISHSLIKTDATSHYMYFGFSGFSVSGYSKVTPKITALDYLEDSSLETSSAGDTDLQPYFKASDIVDLHIIHEVDITGESVPYSSYSVTVKDDKNIFNPMVRGNAAAQFYKDQMFEIYSLVCDVSTNDIMLLLNPEYYVTKVATPRLASITSGNSTANFSLIGPLEYYDNKFLDENELLLSSVTQRTNTRKYLLRIFNNDIDVSAIPEESEITTPFSTESKTQIARIIAQAHAMYLDETTDGKICFKAFGSITRAMYDSSTPFKLALDKQKTNPTFEKVSEHFDSVSVKIYRNNTGAREELKGLNATLFFKCIDDSQENSEIDDGSNLSGYSTVLTLVNGTETYYDEDGNLQTNTNLSSIINKYENIKYARLRWSFGKKYDASTMVFKGNDLFSDSSFKNYNEQSVKDLAFNISVADRDNAGNKKNGGICVTEDFIDVWFSVSTDNHYYFEGEPFTFETIEEILIMYIMSFSMIIGTPSGTPIESDNIIYNYHPEDKSSNVYEVDNPLVTTTRQAEILASYLYLIKNLRIFDASSTWRGDCTLQTSDEILTATLIGADDDKTYENYFSGIIVKNDIDFNGGLSETTVVALPEQKFFEKNGVTSGSNEIGAEIDKDTLLSANGFEI